MNWLELKNLLEAFKGKSMVNNIILITVLFATCQWLNSEVVKPIREMTYSTYTYDTYRMVEFDLNKQREKLINDPDDMKTSDVVKFDYYCNSYFGKEYSYSLAPERKRRIEATCQIISNIYTEKFTKEDDSSVRNFSIILDEKNDSLLISSKLG